MQNKKEGDFLRSLEDIVDIIKCGVSPQDFSAVLVATYTDPFDSECNITTCAEYGDDVRLLFCHAAENNLEFRELVKFLYEYVVHIEREEAEDDTDDGDTVDEEGHYKS